MSNPRVLNNISTALKRLRTKPSNEQIRGQTPFIKMLQAMGYKGDNEGICSGITLFWVDALISGREKVFNEQVRFIDDAYRVITLVTQDQMKKKKLNITDEKLFADNFKNILNEMLSSARQKIKDGANLNELSIEDQGLLEMQAIFENMELYQNPLKYSDFFGKTLSQDKRESISLLTASPELEKQGGLTKLFSERWICPTPLKKDTENLNDYSELQNYFDSLTKIFDAQKESNEIAITLNRPNHILGLHYLGNNTWRVVEPSFLPFADVKADSIGKFLGKYLSVFGNPDIAFNLSMYTTKAKKNSGTLQSMEIELDNFHKQHKINDTIAALNKNNHAVLAILTAAYGTVEELRSLKEAGADLNQADNKGTTPLMTAIYYGRLDNVDILIKSAVNSDKLNLDKPNDAGLTPLIFATSTGQLDIIETLIRSGAAVDKPDDAGVTNLMTAAHKGQLDVVNVLIKLGAAVDKSDNEGVTPLITAAHYGKLDVVDALIKSGASLDIRNNQGSTALYAAAENGHAKTLEVLAGAGANINALNNKNMTPVFIAAREGHVDVIETLIKLNADINKSANRNLSPMHIAAYNNHGEVIKKLFEAGANINCKNDDGLTPLHFAAVLGQVKAAEVLIDAGANLNEKDNDGMTALHNAARGGNSEIVKKLLDAGVDINQQSADGLTAAHYALHNGQLRMLKELANLGANLHYTSNGRTSLRNCLDQGKWESAIILLLATKKEDIEKFTDVPMNTFPLKTIEKSFRTYLKTLDPKQRSEVVHGVINNENALGSILKLSLPKSLYMQMRFVAGRKDENMKIKTAVNDTIEFAKSKLKR